MLPIIWFGLFAACDGLVLRCLVCWLYAVALRLLVSFVGFVGYFGWWLCLSVGGCVRLGLLIYLMVLLLIVLVVYFDAMVCVSV